MELVERSLYIQKIQVIFIFALVVYQNSLRKRSFLTRSGLLRPHQSPWMKLLNDCSEGSFLEMTGFNFESFRLLRNILFEDSINMAAAGIRRRGRPCSLDFDGQVGLYLYFFFVSPVGFLKLLHSFSMK